MICFYSSRVIHIVKYNRAVIDYGSVVVHGMSMPDDEFGVIFRSYCSVQRYCEHFLCISGAYTFSKAVVLKVHPGTVCSSLSPF